jgi:hypothetical protein
MKSRFKILVCTMIVTAFCSVLSAQVNNNLSKAQLVKFTNANAKFTVPPGKTWTLHGIITSFPDDDNTYTVWIKSINGVILTDLTKNIRGKVLYSSNLIVNLNFPLVFPENTVFELLLTKKVKEILSLSENNALLNFSETEN